jgi:toxin secretion/phage lysis holin
MQVLDMFTGLLAGGSHGGISSKIGYKGVMKKAMTLLVIGSVILLELAIQVVLPEGMKSQFPVMVAQVVASLFFLNEMVSVLENADRAGVPVPRWLKKGLASSRAKINDLGGLVGGDPSTSETLVVRSERTEIESHVSHSTCEK